MRTARAGLYLLTLPALGAGWLIGDPPNRSLSPVKLPGKAEAREERATGLPDLWAPGADGGKPSFLEVSLRILDRAYGASGAELARLRREVDDARYQTDPGYDLAHRAVTEALQRQAPYRFLKDTPSASTRRGFFAEWGAKDLRAAFEAALRTPPPGQRMFNLRAALSRGADADPEAALALVRKIQNRRLRENVALWAIRPILARDPDRFEDLAREFPSHASTTCYFAFEAMTKRDPAIATEALANLPAEWRHRAADAVARTWSRTDHAAAYQWAREQEVQIPEELYRNWMAKEPGPALDAAIQSLRSPSAANNIAQMISETAPEQREEIAAWLDTLENDSLRARLAAGLCRGDENPSAAELAAASFGAAHPSGRWEEYKHLANRIDDPAERREFIQSLPPNVSRGTMAWFAGEWLQKQPVDFNTYVRSIPTERGRNHFFRQALSSGNGPRREALREFARQEGIEVP